jgi:branched-chain amino acid transport system ATP-binding protein
VNVALTVAQRAYFMERGQVRFAGPAADLIGRSDLVRSVFLEGAARAAGDGHAGRRRVSAHAATPATAPAEGPMLEVRGLVKSFGGIRAVDGIDLTLARGKILGIIGPNGAGKTTLFDVVSGFLVPDRGRVSLLGEDVTDLSPEARSRKGLGRSFQDARLFPSLTVAENVAVALDRHLPVKEPVAAALGLPVVRREEAALAARADSLIESMGLGAYRDKFVSELSTGTRRIVDIACALAHAPDVLILDEPSSGIAQAETEALGRLLESLRSDLGCSLLVIEHDVPLVSRIADELVAMDLGRAIARGAPGDVVRDPAVVRAYLGTEEGLSPPSKRVRAMRENRKATRATEAGGRGGPRTKRRRSG